MRQSLDEVLQALSLTGSKQLFTPHWEESVRTFPADGPHYLQSERITRHAHYASLPEDATPQLEATARRVRTDEDLRLFSWHCYRLLFEHLDYGQCRQWPPLEHLVPGQTGLFYFLLALEMVALTRAKHRELGIDEAITRTSCGDLRAHLARHKSATGRYGTEQRLLPWLRNHTAGSLFRFGRFQYMRKPFRGLLRVYRRKQHRETIALAQGGLVCSAEGWLLNDLTENSEGVWTTHAEETDTAVTGNVVSPHGIILPETVSLARDLWEPVLGPEDHVLEIHIPSGGGMTPEVSLESMRKAVAFFQRQFPTQPFRGLSCLSWVFNPRFCRILPREANIRRVQEEVYLFPVPSGRKSGLYFIFGEDDIDVDNAPRNTSIRRTLIAELENGRPLLTGGMFILTEDLDAFGTCQYRNAFGEAMHRAGE